MLSTEDAAVAKATLFFGSLPDAVFHRVLDQASVQRLTAGQTLFQQGEPAEAVFAVLDGLLKLFVARRDGNEAVVEVFKAGSSFAEALIFRDDPYPVSATALTEARVLAVSNRVIRSEIYANPDTFGAILGATYAHLHKLVHQIEQLKSNSGLERVIHYILASAPETEGPKAIEIPYEKQVLASLLGMKPETLSRAFRRLQAHGVSVDGRRIAVQNRDGLRRLLTPE